MSVTYNNTLKSTRMTDVVTAIGSAGYIEIGTAGMTTILATINLPNPAGTVTAGVLTFSGTPLVDSSSDNTGTAAAARVRASGAVDIITGLTVGATAGFDIILSSVSIVAGQPTTITTASITHG